MHINRTHVFLTLALFLGTISFPFVTYNLDNFELETDLSNREISAGENIDISILNWPDETSYDFEVDVQDGHSITNLEMEINPSHNSNKDAIEWNSISDWSHFDATYDGVNYNGTYMTTFGVENLWDFENLQGSLPNGWTSSNGANGLVNDNSNTASGNLGYLSCGTNGSSGGSLVLRNGLVNVESNTLDLSGLSNGYIHFWMREGESGCGEDPDSSEHLYFEYWASNGQWKTVPSGNCNPSNTCPYFDANLGSFSAVGYPPQDVSYTLPSDAFWSDFKFRFRLPTGSGTCCDWWFVDDIRLTVPGPGNWTSPSFGTHPNAIYSVEPGQYGFVSIDAKTSGTYGLSWSVIDGITDKPILGYENLNSRLVDLGTIDWKQYPLLRIELNSENGPFQIDSINIQGKFKDTFISDPRDYWFGDYTWDSNTQEISSSSSITSKLLRSHRPIAGWDLNIDLTYLGVGRVEVSVDEGPFYEVLFSDTTLDLPFPAHTLQFKITNARVEVFDLELFYASLPENLKLNIADDERIDWTLDINQIGPWGWQNRFSDGHQVQKVDLINNTSSEIEFWLPSRTIIEHFSFEMWSADKDQTVGGVQWEMSCGNILVDEVNHGPISHERKLHDFDEERLSSLNEALEIGDLVPNSGVNTVEFVSCKLEVLGSGAALMIDGLLATFQKDIKLQFSSESMFLAEFNSYLSGIQTGTSSIISVPIPVTTIYSSKLNFEILDIESIQGMHSELIDFINLTSTLTPSEPWLELVTTHSSSVEVIDTLEVEIAGINNSVLIKWPLQGGEPTILSDIPSNLVDLHPTNSADINQVSTVPQEIEATFKFRLNSTWDDEPFVTISSRASNVEGHRSLPAVQKFGVGDANGIENDFYISEWNVINDLGVSIPRGLSYLKAGTVVTFSAELCFEGLNYSNAPRTDSLLLKLFQDDMIIGQTQEVDGNLMNITIILPPTEQELSYSLTLEKLQFAGTDLTSVNLSRDFQTDSRSPVVLNSSVEKYDHREPSNSQKLQFEIGDRPILPPSLNLMLWREWVNDINYNSIAEPEEFELFPLIPPENLTQVQGNFTYEFSDLLGKEGDLVTGYIIGADAAGNLLEMGGSSDLDQQLFTYQLMEDGAPELFEETAFWDVDSNDVFRHPMIDYSMVFPLAEPNGMSDISLLSLSLDNSLIDEDVTNSLEIRWDGYSRQCMTDSDYLEIGVCDIFARSGSVKPYTTELEFRVTFAVKWKLPDNNQVRTPEILIKDRGGNEDIISYPDLAWKFNTEIWIPYESIEFEFLSGSQDFCPMAQSSQNPTLKCVWVSPESKITISGEVQFYWTNELPTEELDIEILISGLQPTLATVENGIFSAEITVPSANGGYVLSWELFALPLPNIDQTSQSTVSLIVDGESPIIVEVVKPRIDVDLAIEDMFNIEFEANFKETYIDSENIILNWRVVYNDNPSVSVVDGEMKLDIVSTTSTGTMIGSIRIGDLLSDSHYSKPSELHLWISGSDLAGNLLSSEGNSQSDPLAKVPIHYRRAIVEINTSDIQYAPSGEQNSGEKILITILARNVGDAQGQIFFTIYEVLPSGATKTIADKNETIPLTSQPIQLTYEWVPESEGLNRIRVEWNNQETEGPFIEVLPPKATGLNAVFEGSNPLIVVSFVGLIVAVLILLVLVVRRGKGDEYEWVEEWEDVDNYDTPSKVPPVIETAKVQTPTPVQYPPVQKEPETRYQNDVYGSAYSAATQGKGDGWWQDEHGQWWQKSDDGNWWHQSPDGQWHKLDGY